MSRHNPWRPAGPTVSPAMARTINEVRRVITHLVVELRGHAELLGCLKAAEGAVAECARIATRDVDRARPPAPAKKKRLAPAKTAKATIRR